jgi:hypothetical protein
MKANPVKEIEAFLKSSIPETAAIEYVIIPDKERPLLVLESTFFYSWHFEPIMKAIDKFENIKFWICIASKKSKAYELVKKKGAKELLINSICINFYLTT